VKALTVNVMPQVNPSGSGEAANQRENEVKSLGGRACENPHNKCHASGF
jgi:hypothetical protein